MDRFFVENFGQISHAELELGDFTLLIGPQASGKNILLQLFKLIHDYTQVARSLKKQGYAWNSEQEFLELYFGENLGGLWNQQTVTSFNGRRKEKKLMGRSGSSAKSEKLFYIPAQRVTTLSNGWPRSFLDFSSGDPYVVRDFSENIRLLMESGLGGQGGVIFPQDRRLKKEFRDHLDNSIFHGASLELDKYQLKRRLILNVAGQPLRFMTWSAGQREFMPLLLGLYWLLPSSAVTKKEQIDWVVIEEPEMGLHPNAILSQILLFMELMHRGYKLIVSSHSPVIPEVLWAIGEIKQQQGSADDLKRLFKLPRLSQTLRQVFDAVLQEKLFKSYYFNLQNKAVTIQDISSLDPAALDDAEADWGGLTSVSSQAAEIVASLEREE